jgi:serine/threonine protein kinase
MRTAHHIPRIDERLQLSERDRLWEELPTELTPQLAKAAGLRWLNLLGEGSYGWVVAAESTATKGALYAVKVFKPEAGHLSPEIERELKRLGEAGESHDRILGRVGELEDVDGFWLCKTYLHAARVNLGDGKIKWVSRSLDKLVGKLNGDEVQAILLQVADALSFLHSKGVVHCDVKLSNVVLTEEGNVKLCDFGQSWSPGDPIPSLSGTRVYSCPEQLTGQEPNKDWDVYSFGVFAWMLIMGEYPRLTPELVKQVEQEAIGPPIVASDTANFIPDEGNNRLPQTVEWHAPQRLVGWNEANNVNWRLATKLKQLPSLSLASLSFSPFNYILNDRYCHLIHTCLEIDSDEYRRVKSSMTDVFYKIQEINKAEQEKKKYAELTNYADDAVKPIKKNNKYLWLNLFSLMGILYFTTVKATQNLEVLDQRTVEAMYGDEIKEQWDKINQWHLDKDRSVTTLIVHIKRILDILDEAEKVMLLMKDFNNSYTYMERMRLQYFLDQSEMARLFPDAESKIKNFEGLRVDALFQNSSK